MVCIVKFYSGITQIGRLKDCCESLLPTFIAIGSTQKMSDSVVGDIIVLGSTYWTGCSL